jgi:hypothetical protein
VPALAEELNEQGYRTKVQRRTSGPHRGGCVFRRGTLYHLLSNRIYRGMIVHKGKAYAGEHKAIVDEDLWDRVQAQLAENACGSSRRKRHQHPSLLIGKVFDCEGRRMTPSHAQRGRKRYRYYVTRPEEVDGSEACRVNAHDLEQLVCEQLAERFETDRFILDNLGETADLQADRLQRFRNAAIAMASQLRRGNIKRKAGLLDRIIARVDLKNAGVNVRLDEASLASELDLDPELMRGELPITVPAVRVRRGHQLLLVIPGDESERPKPARRDTKLIALVAEAMAARKLVENNPDRSIASIAEEHGRCRTRLGKLVRLSCLAPDIVQSIVEGRQPDTLDVRSFGRKALPLDWADQREALGFT